MIKQFEFHQTMFNLTTSKTSPKLYKKYGQAHTIDKTLSTTSLGSHLLTVTTNKITIQSI